jgi:hypothetical protein
MSLKEAPFRVLNNKSGSLGPCCHYLFDDEGVLGSLFNPGGAVAKGGDEDQDQPM